MLIKNAIVLVDEINVQTAADNDPFTAILNSGTNRLMPVVMAASTTALGMLPLVFDAFFVSMAVTIIFGLMCATVPDYGRPAGDLRDSLQAAVSQGVDFGTRVVTDN